MVDKQRIRYSTFTSLEQNAKSQSLVAVTKLLPKSSYYRRLDTQVVFPGVYFISPVQ